MKITKRQLRRIIKEEKAKLSEVEESSLPPEWEGTRTLEDQEFDELFGYFIELGIPADSEFLNHPDLDSRKLGAILDIWEGRRMV